jgi:hypothetical protein
MRTSVNETRVKNEIHFVPPIKRNESLEEEPSDQYNEFSPSTTR